MIWFVLLLCAGATYRVGRFIVLDDLIQEPRDVLLDRITSLDETGDGGRRVVQRHESEWGLLSLWRRKLYQLLTCPHCITGWISAGVVAVADQYEAIPLPVFFWLTAWSGGLVFWAVIDSE